MPGNGYPMRLSAARLGGQHEHQISAALKLTDQPAMTYYESKIYLAAVAGRQVATSSTFCRK
jgi:hypothetical protein